MAQVISASRRTDIPGFYSEWFVNRLRAGFVYVQQPYSGRMSRVSLLPGDVNALVFWSKNYGQLLGRLEDVEKTTRNLFFHFTITGNHELEFHVPDPREAVGDYIHIARRYSPDHIIWRYDPVCITDKLSFETHQERFVRCAELLQGHAKQCIISFAHPYRKAIENFKKYTDHAFVDLSGDVKRAYAERLAEKAARYGIRLMACCNDGLVSEQIGKVRCIDGRRLSLLFGSPIDVRAAASRRECGCTRSTDIGAYDTCGHGCLYCYANSDKDRARSLQHRHEPEWNSLRADVREVDGGLDRKG
ncbi:MAG TPA: DUF1848 domain-containing protein [Nitrospirota bacterium]|nr:DUF1848 domain-containing protein [Nitrospirota bacterium]